MNPSCWPNPMVVSFKPSTSLTPLLILMGGFFEGSFKISNAMSYPSHASPVHFLCIICAHVCRLWKQKHHKNTKNRTFPLLSRIFGRFGTPHCNSYYISTLLVFMFHKLLFNFWPYQSFCMVHFNQELVTSLIPIICISLHTLISQLWAEPISLLCLSTII